ncbi:serine/threonine-protein kinase [Actinotalea ferrariae]|uniref:serine/threonine-protein kinase n=1 Tax=Actinotalea ferrariae TaxID=1386098 RepID=UPI0027DFE2C5|nr:serine/threonine-protein kinase [Actinotalea ferrariae]
MARGVLLDDRYRLEDVLGQGGMATVYRAHDLVLDRDVAVKLFPPVADDADDLLRHRSEMRVLAQLSHPGLVTLHDAGAAFTGGPMRQTYLVMELVDGPTLADRLTEGPLSPRHTARLGRQVAEALAVVHAADVVHRDVKPANVLLVDRDRLAAAAAEDPAAAVTTGPIVKLADFGIARLADGARLTVTGTTLGTATYLSPEQAAGSPVGPPTDVYALGLVLLECLTGRKAFTGTVVEVAAARLNSAPPIPTEFGPEWVVVLQGMTRMRPEERLTASEAANRLAALAEDGVTTGEVPTGAHALPAYATSDDGAATAGLVAPLEADGRASVAGLPASIPPRVPPPPVRRRGEVDGAPAGPDATHQFSPAEIREAAERAATSPRRRPTMAEVTGPQGRPSRQNRRAALAALGVVVVGAGALVAGRLAEPDAPPEPPAYPVVDGTLGDALVDLQQSVEP